MKLSVLLAAAALLLAGCGGDEEATPTDTDTTTVPAETTELRVYWLRDGKVWPALREIDQTTAIAQAALDELLAGPTAQEGAELEFTTAIPEDTEGVVASVEDGVATVELSTDLTDEPLAQVVYTLTQFVTVESVDIQGNTLTRADFEDFTPAVLVESPLSFETVASPLRVTGTANTFEATFNYELTDTDGTHRRRELRHGDLGNGDAWDVRLHHRCVHSSLRRSRLADRLRALRQGRLAHQPRRDPPSDGAVAVPQA